MAENILRKNNEETAPPAFQFTFALCDANGPWYI